MNNLKVLINREINMYKNSNYFSSEQKEIIIKHLEKFYDENKNDYKKDLEELERLEKEIDNLTRQKIILKYKYDRYINITELCLMNLKEENKD